MAITIKQPMVYFSPLYDKNAFVIDSSYNDEDNFYYLMDIVDANGTLTSSRVPSDPYGFGVFDPNFITNNKVTYNFNPIATTSEDNTDCFYQYKVSYGSISDGSYDTQTSTNIVNGFNMNFQLDEDSDLDNYFLDDPYSKFLTDFDNTNEITLTRSDYYTFNFIYGNFNSYSSGYSHPYKLNYKFYKTNGSTDTFKYTVSASYEYLSTSTFEANPEHLVQTIGVGVQNLLGMTMDGISVPLTESYFDDIEYYEVFAEYSASEKISITYTVRLKCEGSHNRYQIFYLNSLGAFDGLTFTTENKMTQKQKTSTFLRDPWKSNGTGSYTYTQGNGGLITHDKTIEKELTVNSDFVYENDLPIYERFFQSPVHILYKNGKEYPMVLTNSSINLEDKMNRKIYQIKYTFAYANKTKLNI